MYYSEDMKVLSIACLSLLAIVLPVVTNAATINAGFVEGIWYSNNQPVVGETIRIYTAIRNNTDNDLIGTVEFFVNGKKLNSSPVQALTGRIVEAWADWPTIAGTSSISARLSGTRLAPIGQNAEAVEVGAAESSGTIFVDIDTDGDGIGNQVDTDDDGDGVSDVDEIAAGTDPLVADATTSSEVANVSAERLQPATTTDEAIGLEQFLTDGITHDTLANFTEAINTSKQNLDEYRAARKEVLGISTTTDPTGNADLASTTDQYDQNGFGTVTRSQSNESSSSPWHGLGSIFSTIYTFILWCVSLYLGHPAIVQITLLILIIFVVYKTARRLGCRSQ